QPQQQQQQQQQQPYPHTHYEDQTQIQTDTHQVINDPYDADSESQDEYFAVENILKGRIRNNTEQFLVKWDGYTSSFNSWQTKDTLNQESLQYIKDHPE
ncbi:chromo domain-containing protein, partial [Acinetobacter baumannii]|uniref:chromo domain-containing protein n=1 Tax=Acinetobacter baumannii TaxID=470 RepID=UPI001178C40C